jgi:ATP-dependent DNA helicase PIF1
MTQKEALDILKTGRNVFLTGAAGSGKTYVLREYINYLRGLDARVGITASTGIAATHMGGTTIHSWSGIGVRDSLNKSELAEIAGKSHIKKNVQKASVLIIDEISMLHHFQLDMIDRVAREVKNSDLPFGGLQIIFCGDFFQLPPVHRTGSPESFFAYHSGSWKNLGLKVCYLSEQHRQSDLEFLKVLNAVRDATVTDEITQILQTRFSPKSNLGSESKADIEATKLYSHNRNVDTENESELGKLPGRSSNYEMQSRGRHPLVESLKKSCLAPEILKLKPGAKVMFVKNNFEEGYVNGTLANVVKCGYEEIQVKTISGKIIDVERGSWVIEEDGKIKAEINQYPLRLAWAITVHKSQGMSLDAAEIDLSQSFERGMGYVALSRVRSLEGLFLKGLNEMALKINEEVLEIDKKFRALSKTNSFHINTMGEAKVSKMHGEFADKIRGERIKEKKLSTMEETKKMLDEGAGIKEIAVVRNLKLGTILDHVEKIKEKDPKYNIYNLRDNIPKNKFRDIYNAFRKIGMSQGGIYHLAPVKELLGPKYSYDDLRLVRLFL